MMNVNNEITFRESNSQRQNNSPTALEHPESANSELSVRVYTVLDRDLQWPDVLQLITTRPVSTVSGPTNNSDITPVSLPRTTVATLPSPQRGNEYIGSTPSPTDNGRPNSGPSTRDTHLPTDTTTQEQRAHDTSKHAAPGDRVDSHDNITANSSDKVLSMPPPRSTNRQSPPPSPSNKLTRAIRLMST